eukprot:CAMPEP_0118903512 /NCGR_PEP_ID=MMETSP1166-20130328/8350_1 /TAXON_ID=1104430 /ORGANISM="Chrysoreinhardia sp, Strain CCMP3193" /LENGTH=176 /DNA_ID=CAMNT_0006842739 /DNA_START=1 /DNA_END=528 /DNA_ORIENTATION=+
MELSFYGDVDPEEVEARFGAVEATFFGCGLTTLGSLRVDWCALRKLNVSSNDLCARELFEPLDASASLEQLDASSNRIASFYPATLPQLRSLNLSFNQLETLRGASEVAPRLTTLDVRSNQLRQVVSAFLPASLTALKVAGNPLEEGGSSRTPQKGGSRTQSSSSRKKGLDDDDDD